MNAGRLALRGGCAAAAIWLASCAPVPLTDSTEPGVETHKAELSRADSQGVVSLPAVERHLDAMMARLQRAAGAQGRELPPIKVYVTASGYPNAFAVDGKVYVPWRALSLIDSDRELAALLAHEASHLLLRHADLDARTAWIGPLSNLGMLAAASTGIGAIAGMLVSVGGQYTDRVTVAGWQRDQELQADARGLELMQRAGYEQIGLVELLETLSQSVASAPFAPSYTQKRLANGRTELTFNPGALTFSSAEASHPTTTARRAQAERLMSSAPAASDPQPALPPDTWPELKADRQVAAMLAGLEAADDALRLDPRRDRAAARQRVQQAIASPAAASYPVYVAALAVLSPAEMASAGLPPPAERLLAPGTPSSGVVVVLRVALEANNGALAARAADIIDARYDAPTSLYNWLARAHELRAAQVRARMATPSLPVAEQMSLLAESVARDSKAFGIRTKCLALARNPNQLASCGPK